MSSESQSSCLGALGLEETFILTITFKKPKLSNKLRCTSIKAEFLAPGKDKSIWGKQISSFFTDEYLQLASSAHTGSTEVRTWQPMATLSQNQGWSNRSQASQNDSVAMKPTHEAGDLLWSPSQAVGLDPPLSSYIGMARPPTRRCFGLSPAETADLVSGHCLHIYPFENTIAKAIQAEQEEMQNSRTVGGFLLTGAGRPPACDAHLAQGLALLPALGPLCSGRLPHPSLAHSSPAPQNVLSTWQIFLQENCR